jgi:DNA-binding response OmpR family regulator
VVRQVLAEHLADAGFSVLAAADGDEAPGLLDGGEAVDAMVTDLAMPGMDGIALIRAIQERRHGLPVVPLTGDAGGDAALALSGAVSGTYSMLRKPVTGSVLAGRVRALLDGVSRPPLRGP